MIHNNVLSLIGQTPMVELTKFDTGPCRLFIKLEYQNPGGSIKDRPALYMIEAAERDGRLKPNGEIIEATAGNTGLGLALISLLKGYKLTLVVPDKMSREKISQLRAYGASVVLTRSDVGKGHPEYYQDLAKTIAAERGAYFIDQFNNPANAESHYRTTGPEIFNQTNGQIDVFVTGVGSSGHLAGITRFFKEVKPQIEIVLADPDGSILAPMINTGQIPDEAGSWLVEGIGEDFIPSIADFTMCKRAFAITDAESFEAARQLLKLEGIFAGSSTGTQLAAALKYCQMQITPKNVVFLAYDSGTKYLSKMFSDVWMEDNGYISRQKYGDLRDFISRKTENNETIGVGHAESLRAAFKRMKDNDVSQLPVFNNQQVVGIIDEEDVLLAVAVQPESMQHEVNKFMSSNLIKLPPSADRMALFAVLQKGYVAIIESDGVFHGLITRMDYIRQVQQK